MRLGSGRASVPADGCLGPKRHQRCRARHDRRRPAGRHDRGVESGVDRENPRGSQRRFRALHDRGPAAGSLRRDLFALRVQHAPPRRRGTADELHDDAQRRYARGRPRREHHRNRRHAGRGRPEHAAHAGADARHAGLGADRAQLLGPCGADAGRPVEQHGRGRQPADGTDLHDRPRLAPDRHHDPGRRHDAEQPDERWAGPGLLQRRRAGGDELPDERGRRRRVRRRRPHQHDSRRTAATRSAARRSSAAPTAAGRPTT